MVVAASFPTGFNRRSRRSVGRFSAQAVRVLLALARRKYSLASWIASRRYHHLDNGKR